MDEWSALKEEGRRLISTRCTIHLSIPCRPLSLMEKGPDFLGSRSDFPFRVVFPSSLIENLGWGDGEDGPWQD